ncbi:MAG: sensor histidine kinase [Planctomycetota bacterium]
MSTPVASPVPRLPRLLAGHSAWHLPLNDYAAFELARLLVVEEVDEREALVAQLMSVDPSVTLWTACAAAGHGEGGLPPDSEPCCVVDLASWLARAAPRCFHWSADELAEPSTDPVHRTRWGELAADAVAVGNLAANPIADDDVAAEAFLCGLLYNAADWLRSCGPRISIPKQQHGCLPPWLVKRLRERSRPPRSEPMQHVLRAAKAWRESGRRTRQVAGLELTDAFRARGRWQSGSRSTQSHCHLLAQLTRKLCRLEELERDYSGKLEQEKLASLGELAYGASHEINNPLANISTRAQALLLDEPDPERRRMLAIINTQAFRANEMIADMMLFARPPELVREQVDLVKLAEALVHELADEASLQGTQLTRTGAASPLWGSVDETQLTMAFRALVVNALQALGANGEIEMRVQRIEAVGDRTGRSACIAVRDTAAGIPPPVRRHLFDPFYSGREAGRGLGLGLAKCWRVVSLHGGHIDVASASGQGTTFSVTLPLEPGHHH